MLAASLTFGVLLLAPQDAPEREIEVVGRVFDTLGQPIEGAAVGCITGELPGFRELLARPGARTGIDGSVTVSSRTGDGAVRVIAAAEGRAMAWQQWRAEPAVARVDVGDLFLGPGTTLRGRVREATGRPLGGVRVIARDFGGNRIPSATRTGDDGVFELPGIPPTGVRVTFAKDGYESHARPGVVSDTPLSITLQRAERFTGRVFDAAGRPVQATVQLKREDGHFHRLAVGVDGRFEGQVPRGLRYRLTSWRKESSANASSAILRGPGEDLELRFPSEEDGTTLELRVTDTAGEAVPVFTVTAIWEIRSDSGMDLRNYVEDLGVQGRDGRVVLVPDATWSPETGRLLVQAPGQGEVCIAAPAPKAGEPALPLTVTMPSERTISGRVLDEDGAGLAGVEVHARFVRGNLSGTPSPVALTGDRGSFHIGGLGRSPYALVAWKQGRGAVGRAVDLSEGSADAVDLVLPAGRSLSVRFENVPSTPGWDLILVSERRTARVEFGGAQHRFTPPLAPTRRPVREEGLRLPVFLGAIQDAKLGWRSRFGANVHLPLEERMTVSGDGTLVIDLREARVGRVAGRVAVEGTGAGQHRLAVVASSPRGQAVLPVDRSGRFACDVLAGEYTLEVTEPFTRMRLGDPVQVTIEPEGTCETELTATVGPLRVEVRPAPGWERPAASEVRFGDPPSGGRVSLVDVVGPFEVLAPPGVMTVRLQRVEGALGVDDSRSTTVLEERVEVKAGNTVDLVLQEPERLSDEALARER